MEKELKEITDTEITPTQPVELVGEKALENASVIAKKIQKIVTEQGLAVKVGTDKSGKDKLYAMVEAWNMIGTMLGYSPRVTKNERIEREGGVYGYEAWVELVDSTGFVKARANALAFSNEMKGNDRYGFKPAPWTANEFSIASMAQTRAIGKAYRLGLSWVMKMAGYEPTPYEEMNLIEVDADEQPQIKRYTQQELKEIAVKKLTSAKTPDEYFTVYENIKKSKRFTDEELEEIIKKIPAIDA